MQMPKNIEKSFKEIVVIKSPIDIEIKSYCK